MRGRVAGLVAAVVWLWTAPALADAPLVLDRASAEELARLEHVGVERAQAIVALRERRGGLGSVEELRVLSELDEPALASLRANTAVEVTLPVEAPTTSLSTPEEVLARFEHEPSIQQVQDWTNLYANTSPDLVRRWLAQSRSFAVLPQVTLSYELQDDWDQGFTYLTADGTEATTPEDDVFPIIDDADQGQMNEYQVRLVWNLNEIVMSSERIRVINEAQDIVKLRDRVLTEVTRLYYERRRLQVERLLAPKADLLARVKEELRLRELTANIDALTGGAFSGATAGQP